MLNLCGFNGNDCMKELMSMMRWKQSKWRMSLAVAVLAIVVIGSIWLNVAPFRSGFEITDELGGNIFPSSILSVATTDAQVIVPVDSMFVGNPKSCIAVKVRSAKAYSRVRVEVAETPFFSRPFRSSYWRSRVPNILFTPILSGTMKR